MTRLVKIALRAENWLVASNARAIIVALIVMFLGLIVAELTDGSVVRYYILVASAVFVGFLVVLDGYARKLRKQGKI